MEELTITDALLAPLRDQVVLVTGGASGIGLATVSLLLSLGAKVISVDWKEEEEAGQVVSEKEDYQYVKADVTSWVDLRAAFNLAIKKHGHIDHVFANAGACPALSIYLQVKVHVHAGRLVRRRQTTDSVIMSQASTSRASSGTMIWMPVEVSKNRISPPSTSASSGPSTRSSSGSTTSSRTHAVVAASW